MPQHTSTVYYGGINGATGRPAIPPLTVQQLSAAIRQLSDPVNLRELRLRHQRDEQIGLGLREGVSACHLDVVGWGIVFAEDADPAVEEALSELIAHRRGQAGDRCRVFKGASGVRCGQIKTEWLVAQGVGPVVVNPDKVPYYLLLVGSPEAIPFQFQSLLSVDYAVGRIHFNTLQEYANYARSVVLAEKRRRAYLPRRIAFYGAVNGVDSDAEDLRRALVAPLSDTTRALVSAPLNGAGGLDAPDLSPGPCPDAAGVVAGWQVETYMAQDAGRRSLLSLLGDGGRAPALLFAGGHGYEPANPICLLFEQGALITSDWDGRRAPVPRDSVVGGEDVAGDMNLLGMIAFFFACYSGGTPPEADEFVRLLAGVPVQPPYPFVAHLPSRMLSAPGGGALAVIAQVAPTFSYSYDWPGVGEVRAPFEDCLAQLLRGYPIGHAVQPFYKTFASYETELAALLRTARLGGRVDDSALFTPWLAGYTAGNHIILGDPAVRINPTTLKPDAKLPKFKPTRMEGLPQSDSWPAALPVPCQGGA